ncbi:hypothetical protein R8Z50_15850 [Longispora sp. K20-0274]|uniref:hypothetical protein n=1 Tax=Longispora sp. K20-0274 TaxID=3088255 RepID=UPI00399B6B4E
MDRHGAPVEAASDNPWRTLPPRVRPEDMVELQQTNPPRGIPEPAGSEIERDLRSIGRLNRGW